MKKKYRVIYNEAVFGSLFSSPEPSLKFWRDWKYFDTEKEALNHINQSLGKGGMGGQLGGAYLYERKGRRWRYVNRYWRKTKYVYEDGENVGYASDDIEVIPVRWSHSTGDFVLF